MWLLEWFVPLMAWLIVYGFYGFFCGLFVVFAIIILIELIGRFIYTKHTKRPILDSKEFHNVFKEEVQSLGLDNLTINYHFRKDVGPSCYKENDGNYTITFNEFNNGTMRHELYHIYAGHCDYKGSLGVFRFLFLMEPVACLYAVFGLKL